MRTLRTLAAVALFSLCTLASCRAAGSEAEKASDMTDSIETQTTIMEPDTNSVKVAVETTAGNFTVLLYGDTPLHRDNFVKLVKEGYYDGTLFHRVINEFMIQAGDPDSRDAKPGQRLGMGGPDYKIDAEIVFPKHFHKRGSLAAARQGDQVNPEKKSSGSQFYIVTGRKSSPREIEQLDTIMVNRARQQIFNRLAQCHRDSIMAMQRSGDREGLEALRKNLIAQTEVEAASNAGMKVTPEMREAYTTVGGAPHLDGDYTVFGEVIEGMDTIDKIEKVETDGADRPVEDVRIISMKILPND